jgi:hypothetical protein
MRNSAQILAVILALMIIFFIVYGILVQTRKGISINDFFLQEEVSLKDLQPAVKRYNDDTKREWKEEVSGDNQVSGNGDYGEVGCYYIIVGSFKENVAAQNKAEKLKRSLDGEFILLPLSKEGNFRISYGRYSTLEEAEATIDRVRQSIDRGAWIYSAN